MKKPYVAIVDDDSAFANYLRTFLSLRGYETRSYSRGDELLASVKQGDPPDIVLLDVMMPGMNGLETLRALKAAKPDLQVIMLSGREQASTIVEAVRLGAADYVVKPDDPEGLGEIALDAAIKSAIEKTRLVSEITELRRQLSDDQDRAFLFWGDSPEMKTIAHGHRAGVRQRRHRADSRRERRRQGAGRARHPPALVAQGSAVRQGELRGAAGGAARERAVRPREGRVHRRGDDAHRQVRAGRHRHDLPRRDRRDEGRRCRPSCCTCCRTRSSRSSAATSRSTSTCASSPPPTAISKR